MILFFPTYNFSNSSSWMYFYFYDANVSSYQWRLWMSYHLWSKKKREKRKLFTQEQKMNKRKLKVNWHVKKRFDFRILFLHETSQDFYTSFSWFFMRAFAWKWSVFFLLSNTFENSRKLFEFNFWRKKIKIII